MHAGPVGALRSSGACGLPHKTGHFQSSKCTYLAGCRLSVLTIGEIRRGLENIRNRGDDAQADRLEVWLDTLVSSYARRILGFDLECAQLWGRLMSPSPQHPIDKQIAAIALIHDLTIVTRNTSDFAATGARLLNPFVS